MPESHGKYVSDAYACECIEGHTNVRCPVQFVYLSIIIHRTPRHWPQPRGSARGWRTFILDIGPCQLTRNTPLSGGLKDICTWYNFVTNDMSSERAQGPGESIMNVKKNRSVYYTAMREFDCDELNGIGRLCRGTYRSAGTFDVNDRYPVIGLSSRQVSSLRMRSSAPGGFTRIRFLPVYSRVMIKVRQSLGLLRARYFHGNWRHFYLPGT